jgi:hypothetical protein
MRKVIAEFVKETEDSEKLDRVLLKAEKKLQKRFYR